MLDHAAGDGRELQAPAIAWNYAYEYFGNGLDESWVFMFWTEIDEMVGAAQAGHHVISAWDMELYLDYGSNQVEGIYNFDPCAYDYGLNETTLCDMVLGESVNFWSSDHDAANLAGTPSARRRSRSARAAPPSRGDERGIVEPRRLQQRGGGVREPAVAAARVVRRGLDGPLRADVARLRARRRGADARRRAAPPKRYAAYIFAHGDLDATCDGATLRGVRVVVSIGADGYPALDDDLISFRRSDKSYVLENAPVQIEDAPPLRVVPDGVARFPELWASAFSDYEVYTVRELRRFVEYARVRGVAVLPEFDTPGHSKSMCRGAPDDACMETLDGQLAAAAAEPDARVPR
ncbi:N-acetyl-beta-D-galactosaminidase [Aureococcus anophagefferens]|nr:N-acetyl-beta-D-galactosaminidase [Aureococcus anophagefferens]